MCCGLRPGATAGRRLARGCRPRLLLGDVGAAAAPCGHTHCARRLHHALPSPAAGGCIPFLDMDEVRGQGEGVGGPCPHLLAGQLCCLGMPGAGCGVRPWPCVPGRGLCLPACCLCRGASLSQPCCCCAISVSVRVLWRRRRVQGCAAGRLPASTGIPEQLWDVGHPE